MFKATISNASILVNSISTISELINEGIFNLEKSGISFVAADRAMVAVVNFNLSSRAFDSYEIDKGQKIGLNLPNLLSVLKRIKSEDKLTISLKESKLELVLQNSSKRSFTLPILELAEEEIPQVEQLQFTAKVELDPEVFQSGLEDAEVVSDSVVFAASPSKFQMYAEGDISQAQLELEKGEKAKISTQTEIKSRYPLEYLKKMMKAVKLTKSITIEFGQDYPMRIAFKGENVNLSFVLAPRVSE